MSHEYLDGTGLTRVWNKIKSYINTVTAGIVTGVPIVNVTYNSSTNTFVGTTPGGEAPIKGNLYVIVPNNNPSSPSDNAKISINGTSEDIFIYMGSGIIDPFTRTDNFFRNGCPYIITYGSFENSQPVWILNTVNTPFGNDEVWNSWDVKAGGTGLNIIGQDRVPIGYSNYEMTTMPLKYEVDDSHSLVTSEAVKDYVDDNIELLEMENPIALTLNTNIGGSVSVSIQSNVVHMHGQITLPTQGASAGNVTIATLPVKYRPPSSVAFRITNGGGINHGALVLSTGVFQVYRPASTPSGTVYPTFSYPVTF